MRTREAPTLSAPCSHSTHGLHACVTGAIQVCTRQGDTGTHKCTYLAGMGGGGLEAGARAFLRGGAEAFQITFHSTPPPRPRHNLQPHPGPEAGRRRDEEAAAYAGGSCQRALGPLPRRRLHAPLCQRRRQEAGGERTQPSPRQDAQLRTYGRLAAREQSRTRLEHSRPAVSGLPPAHASPAPQFVISLACDSFCAPCVQL